jgi:rhodanese-related sulfurtransferase
VPITTPANVKAIVDQADGAAASHIVSVRAEDVFQVGHIPGAVNIPWRAIVDEESLGALGDGPIVVYCYTGHTGQVAATILGLMGYDVVNMKCGMMGWTSDPDVLGVQVFDCEPPQYETEDDPTLAAPEQGLPVLNTGETTPEAITKARAAAFLPDWSPTVSPAEVKGIVDDPAQAADYVIVDVRSAADYADGHLPGAIHIPWRTLADEGTLESLPVDKTIITYCYSGHTGQIAATMLKLLGYDAVNMQYGMMAWNDAYMGGVEGCDCDAVPNYETVGGDGG